jgi:SAM-dependent methyltransferase
MSAQMTTSKPTEHFDEYADNYNEALGKALAASGEGREYFAEGRVAWVARCLTDLGVPQPRVVLDFGCGDGFTAPMLRDALKAPFIVGVDVSSKSIEVAREKYGTRASDSFIGRIITFERLGAFKPAAEMDVAYCNGVFHHIPPAERDKAVGIVRDALKPGGLFAFWENNPWNPATRFVMSRCEFDKDAQMLRPATARKLLKKNGFEIVRTDYRFIFPRSLRLFRRIEDFVFKTPLGTQYMVLARKL